MSWNQGPALPTTMRAALLTGYGGPDVLQVGEAPVPAFAPHNEVLVKVAAAGLNPFEAKLRRGWLAPMFPLDFPKILGCDVAGTIAAKGFDVSEFEVGDRVWGLVDAMRPGTYGEYVAAPSFLVRRMPANLSFAEAAAVPTAACTAWYGLKTLGGIKAGDRVLIQAGSGGVGGFAIQIAKHFGAWVATTASAANGDFVRGLGADEVIDYAADDFTRLQDIDLVLDVLGGEVGQRSFAVLRRGGTMLVVLRGDQVEMANRAANEAKHGVSVRIVAFSAQPEILDALRPLFEAGTIRVPLEATFALADVAAAHARLDAGHARGKLAMTIA